MTTGIDIANRKNFYKWSTSQATQQSYDVVMQVPLPSDFSAWASTTPLTIDTYSTDIVNGTVFLELRDSTNSVETNVNFASVTPSSTSTWQTKTSGTVSGTYTAGDYVTIRVRMYSTNTVPANGVRIGNITLNYLSKW
jgi:hypothetical protein